MLWTPLHWQWGFQICFSETRDRLVFPKKLQSQLMLSRRRHVINLVSSYAIAQYFVKVCLHGPGFQPWPRCMRSLLVGLYMKRAGNSNWRRKCLTIFREINPNSISHSEYEHVSNLHSHHDRSKKVLFELLIFFVKRKNNSMCWIR